MNPSHNEIYNIDSVCQICNRYMDGRRSVKACITCFTEVKEELKTIQRQTKDQNDLEERQGMYWYYKYKDKVNEPSPDDVKLVKEVNENVQIL